MQLRILGVVIAMVASFSAATAGGALAQQEPAPGRNGNVWDGQNHQPTAGAVNEKLQQSGLPPEKGDGELRDLNQIDHQLNRQVEQDIRQGAAPQGGQGAGQ